MIKYVDGNVTTNVRQWMFPDGGVGVDINIGSALPNYDQKEILVKITFGDEKDDRGVMMRMNDHIIALGQTMDALRLHYPIADFYLIIGYMPYARQDRICRPGEGNSLRFVANMINGMDFCTVAVVDPHSTVTEALLNGCDSVSQFDVFKNIKPSFRDTYIVSPDQGATKKCEEFASRVGAAGVITCMKTRVGSDIKIRILDEIPNNAKLLVLDDICDAGGTFINLSKAICDYTVSRRQVVDELDLAVTHGLFTKGFDVVKPYFDKVYTTNTVSGDKGDAIVLDII